MPDYLARSNTNPTARTVGPMFLFPNRYIVFEGIYGVLASCKGLPAVGAAHSDHYANFPHLQVSDTVVNGDPIDICPLAADFCSHASSSARLRAERDAGGGTHLLESHYPRRGKQ